MLSGIVEFIKVPKIIRIGITFCLVSFAWIFFRAESLKDAFYIASHLFDKIGPVNFSGLLTLISEHTKVLGLTVFGWVEVVGAIIAMSLVEFLRGQKNVQQIFSKKPLVVRWAVYYALVLIIIFLATQGREQFIYFQF